MAISRFLLALLIVFGLSGCAETQLAFHMIKSIDGTAPGEGKGRFKVGEPYTIAGKTYYPRERYNYTETGIASWYGHKFHGKETANGETFSRFALSAAHKTLQLPSLVRVTNLENGRSLVVRVNDRGPFKRGRIIDLSERAAALLKFKKQGTARVRIDVLEKASRRIAAAAKRGAPTGGAAIAANRAMMRGQPPSSAITKLASVRSDSQKQRAKDTRKTNVEAEKSTTDIARSTSNTQARTKHAGLNNRTGASRVNQQKHGRNRRIVRRERLSPGRNPSPSFHRASYSGQDRQGSVADQQNASVPDKGVVKQTADVPTTRVDELVTKKKVNPTSLFVQAGSFVKKNNARQLALKLRRVAHTNINKAHVDGRLFYRVRLGPLKTVSRADDVLNRVIALGHNNAMIVVDKQNKS